MSAWGMGTAEVLDSGSPHIHHCNDIYPSFHSLMTETFVKTLIYLKKENNLQNTRVMRMDNQTSAVKIVAWLRQRPIPVGDNLEVVASSA